jgi:hypothetical protein
MDQALGFKPEPSEIQLAQYGDCRRTERRDREIQRGPLKTVYASHFSVLMNGREQDIAAKVLCERTHLLGRLFIG